jgi:predicted Holliday junction resolvase-like endonuclease
MTEMMFILVIVAIGLFIIHLKPNNKELKSTKEAYQKSLQKLGQLEYSLNQANSQIRLILEEKKFAEEKNVKLHHQSKSSQVKTGTFVEALLPLSEQFPCDPKTMRFLGSPIDYISFCYETDMITFVEVKSGDSQLNANQKAVKKMIENGKVQFKLVRLNEKGIKVK